MQTENRAVPEQEEYIELQPAKKELVGWSTGLGLVMLVVLVGITYLCSIVSTSAHGEGVPLYYFISTAKTL